MTLEKQKEKMMSPIDDRTNGHPGHETVYVDQFIDGILDPNKPMLGPVRDGGHIIANTAPGCWGPMLTPEIRGGHEVTKPVAVAGAQVGDAIAIRIKDITITSIATASGNDTILAERCVGDPYVAGKCEKCGTVYPKTVVKGIGQEAIRCAKCGADAAPFKFTNGYTIAFDNNREVGVTLNKEAAETIAQDANYYAAMPENSIQNSVLTFCPADLVGLVGRLRPFMGQLGTTPAIPMPDSHNAGDFGSFLINAPHEYGLKAEDLVHRTDTSALVSFYHDSIATFDALPLLFPPNTEWYPVLVWFNFIPSQLTYPYPTVIPMEL